MAKEVNKRVNVWINGKEVENNVKSIRAAMVQLTNQLNKMDIGSAEYIETSKKLRDLNLITPTKKRHSSDVTHNTARKTLKIKRATDYYYYFETTLPNGETAYIHLGRWRETQAMYIYAISKNLPENIETI